MPSGYGYGNARLRAMRSQLLTQADYRALLARANFEELITALADTPYQPEIEAVLVRMEGVRTLFEALRANLSRTLGQLRGFFEGQPLTLVNLLLRRWDRHNLLSILRGQSQEIPADLILATLVPVGQLDEVSLRELARQPTLRAAIDLMITWQLPYARVLREVQLRGDPMSAFDQLEMTLNRYHYASLWAELGAANGNAAIVLEHLRTEVDLINISTTLRLARIPGVTILVGQRFNTPDVRSLLIEGRGHVPVQQLAELVAAGQGVEDIILGLSETRYGPALAAGWQRYQAGEASLTVLERELERWQAGQTAAMFSRNPLSIAIPLGYIGCKEIEVANLRLIAQTIDLGLARAQAERDLIIV